MTDKFIEHLEHASSVVRNWPSWQQEILGGTAVIAKSAKQKVWEKGRKDFRRDLRDLINRHCQENGSDTPDMVLAQYMTDCLDAFDKATNWRDDLCGNSKRPKRPARID